MLKPVAGWLPPTFQYLGLWMLVCFVLQGVFAAWLVGAWTRRLSLQAAGAAMFVMMPVLLIRIGHPALCSHWLLLWALVIATREPAGRFRAWEWALLGLAGGLATIALWDAVVWLFVGTELGRQVDELAYEGRDVVRPRATQATERLLRSVSRSSLSGSYSTTTGVFDVSSAKRP